MGLQLAWLGPYRAVPVQDLLSKKVPFSERFKKLKPLMLEVFASENEEARLAFEDWFKRIARAKAVRNDYAHGRWGFGARAKLEDPEFEFVALSWEMDPAKQRPSLRLRLSTFAREVALVESLFDEYSELERRFMPTARPGRAWEDQQDSQRLDSSARG
jgi:hypothetical protein